MFEISTFYISSSICIFLQPPVAPSVFDSNILISILFYNTSVLSIA